MYNTLLGTLLHVMITMKYEIENLNIFKLINIKNKNIFYDGYIHVYVHMIHSMCATCIIIMYIICMYIFYAHVMRIHVCTQQYVCTQLLLASIKILYKNITPVIFPSSIFLHQPSSSNLSSLLLFLCATSN